MVCGYLVQPPPPPEKGFHMTFLCKFITVATCFYTSTSTNYTEGELFLDNDIDCGVCTCKRDGTISCEKDAECQGLYIILNDTFNAIDGDFTML